jgi:autophagy-related protein 9
MHRGVSRTEGPLYNEKGFLHDLQQGISNQSLGASVFGSGQLEFGPCEDQYAPAEVTVADMSLSTLYLHELHHRQVSDHSASCFVESIYQYELKINLDKYASKMK